MSRELRASPQQAGHLHNKPKQACAHTAHTGKTNPNEEGASLLIFFPPCATVDQCLRGAVGLICTLGLYVAGLAVLSAAPRLRSQHKFASRLRGCATQRNVGRRLSCVCARKAAEYYSFECYTVAKKKKDLKKKSVLC